MKLVQSKTLPFEQQADRYRWWQQFMGMDPKNALDVGACEGAWTSMITSVFPKAKVVMVEPDVRCHSHLRANYKWPLVTKALTNVDSPQNFWIRDSEDQDTWGSSSLKKELTDIFEKNSKTVLVECTTADAFFAGDTYDLIKLDTQGTEGEILVGGEKLFRRASWVQIECNVVQYNANCTQMWEIFAIMNSFGFTVADMLQSHYWGSGQLTQIDFLFQKVSK